MGPGFRRDTGWAKFRIMSEADFIARLRAIATDPAARGLADDAAVWEGLVLTHDMIVEGIHFLPDDTPQDCVETRRGESVGSGRQGRGARRGACRL
jgi:hypothetical protein